MRDVRFTPEKCPLNHYFVLSLIKSFSVSAAALPARYPASYSADRLLYDQSSTFG